MMSSVVPDSPTKEVAGGPLSGFIERTTKYTKQWSKRYFTFDPSTRKLTYGKDDKSGPKGSVVVTKIVRLSEQFEFKASSPDLLSINVDGTMDDGKAEQWSMRFPDADMFDKWYIAVRGAVSAAGLMDSMNFGLPLIDPRYNLPFATIPLENLHKFGLLEKAIVYFFGACAVHAKDTSAAVAQVGSSLLGSGSLQDTYFVIGDKHVYTFRPSADVVRCFLLSSLVKVHHTPGTTYMCLQLEAPEADLIIKNTSKTKEITEIVRKLFKVNGQGKELPLVAITASSVESFVETCSGLRLVADPDYKMNVASPTPKSRLKFALDMYEKKNGSKFGTKGGALGTTSASSGSPPSDRADRKHSSPSAKEPAVSSSAVQSLGGKDSDMSIPLVRLLTNLRLGQYIVPLLSQHVDLDVLQCMDDTDLETFGVKSAQHRKTILEAAGDGSRLASLASADSLSLDPVVPAKSTTGAASPQSSPKKEIVLSDDDDDLIVAPKAPLILLDDSDDDLLPVVGPASPTGAAPPAPKPTINLDDDDDI